MRLIESDADIQEGLAALAVSEPRFRAMIAQAGPIPLRRHTPGFSGLCSVIVAQQLSVASANAIWRRTTEGLAPFAPETLLAASDDAFRQCGLSAPKIRTLRAIAEAAGCGNLRLDALATMSADEAQEHLVAVRGIGPWTAHIYRMFYLGEADVFAPGDLALQEAIRIGFALDQRPNAKELDAMAAPWSPWRAVAARLLWAYYRAVKTREGVT